MVLAGAGYACDSRGGGAVEGDPTLVGGHWARPSNEGRGIVILVGGDEASTGGCCNLGVEEAEREITLLLLLCGFSRQGLSLAAVCVVRDEKPPTLLGWR